MSDLIPNPINTIARINSSIRRATSRRPKPVFIKTDRILMGGEGDIRAKQYALLTNNPRRPSTRALDGPHYDLLMRALSWSDSDFESEEFRQTPYYRNARECMRVFGDYFPYVTTEKQISLAAKRFIYQARGQAAQDLPSEGHTQPGERILVHQIKDSDCYELLQGNHRVAHALRKNQSVINAIVMPGDASTPIQDLLSNVLWDSGEKLLYQPLNLPELASEWTLLRECSERFEKMKLHLESKNISFSAKTTLLDIGSYFGWFVSQFTTSGINAKGVERDQVASSIGEITYGNTQGRIAWDDAFLHLTTLLKQDKKFDVVCCLSVMHHMVTGREKHSPIEFLKLLDQCTRKILFFEMGESHEKWFTTSLTGWDASHIENWVLENTEFEYCTHLGRDRDSRGKFHGNFGRMLFAFHKE